MSEYVEDCVGALVSTEESSGGDFITIRKDEYDRLVFEREEYRAMCLDFAESVPRFHKVADNIEAIIANGGVTSE